MILDILRPQRSLQLQSAEWARLIPPDPSFNNTIVVWEITCSGPGCEPHCVDLRKVRSQKEEEVNTAFEITV